MCSFIFFFLADLYFSLLILDIKGFPTENELHVNILKETVIRDQSQKAVLIIDTSRANHLVYKFLSHNPVNEQLWESEEPDKNIFEIIKTTQGYLNLVILSSLVSVQMCLERSYVETEISPNVVPEVHKKFLAFIY